MRSDFSSNTVTDDTVNLNKTNAKPRFELNTVQSPPRFATYTRKSARYAREFNSARCHDEAGAIILILLILHC